MNWPDQLQVNAWVDPQNANRSPVSGELQSGLLALGFAARASLLWPEREADQRDWSHPSVGWGLVLADDDAVSAKERATGADAPEALKGLLAARAGAPVLRYRKDRRVGTIRRYYADGAAQDLNIAATRFGTGRAELPRYLLIYGTPAVIPWMFQFELHSKCFAGRLDLQGDALQHYVDALLSEWRDGGSRLDRTLTWAVDLGPGDITNLMLHAVAKPLHQEFLGDTNLKAHAQFLDGSKGQATAAALIEAIAENKPSLIATTSHGRTGPLDDVNGMRANLGILVDGDSRNLDGNALLAAGAPAGAIWYAHACCSAGADAETRFGNLVPANTPVARILNGVAACGAMVSPFPRAVLGAKQPLRAFIGHVEPTFDWSIRSRWTEQFLTSAIIKTLYKCLYRGQPVGMALDACRQVSNSLLASFQIAKDELSSGADTLGDILALQLMAYDWRALVLLGDPTVKLPIQ